MFNFFKRNKGYSYISPMKKAAKSILMDEYSLFEKEVNLAVEQKEPYLIGINGEKFYTEYITEDDYEKLNQRYLLMAKEKDIKIIKRDGLNILKFVIINYVGDDLERYLFVYAQIKKKLIHIKKDELEQNLNLLLKPYMIDFSFDYLSSIQNKYSKNDNSKYTIKHDAIGYSSEVWSLEEIESFKETAKLLEEKGFIFFISNYSSDNRWFGVVKKTDFEYLEKLRRIEVVEVSKLLTDNVGERYFSYKEQFENYYKTIEKDINKNEHETIYKIAASNKPSSSLSQIGGKGIGIDNSNYPMFGDTPMQHVLTFDLQDFPILQKDYSNVRAISLYISDFNQNEAFEAYEDKTKILLLTQDDIANKNLDLEVNVPIKAMSIEIKPIQIPKGLLAKSVLDYEEDSWKRKLYNYFYNFNYVGGNPIWMQNDSHVDTFIAQFDESLFEHDGTLSDIMNFGGGIMYMFEETAFWQCG